METAADPDDRGECAGAFVDQDGTVIECDDPRHPYHRVAALARASCSPEADGKRDDLREFIYQTRAYTRTYVFEDRRWKVASSLARERARPDHELKLEYLCFRV